MSEPATPSDSTSRGSAAPVLIIVAITIVVMLAGVLVVFFPEQTGVPGLSVSPTSTIATPAMDATGGSPP